MTLKNRILMSSMGVGLGYTNQRVKAFYLERARGGVGAISIGAGIPDLFVSDQAWGKPGAVKPFIERLRTVTDEIRRAGSKVGIQFYYGNRYPFTLDPRAGELVAPSARREPDPPRSAWVNAGDYLRELKVEEIESIIATFGKAAAAARQAGFDFVEIHNAHGLLPCQFFSPATNRRTDEYGGNLERRMQFGLECVRSMRRAVGDDYPLFARHGVMDAVPNGFSITEGVAFAVELERAGIDVLNVSLGTPPFQGGYVPAGEDAIGTHVHLAAAVKQKVSAPVVAVGRIKTPEFAEAILAAGKADIIALGRQLICDPYWPEKAAEGKADEIIPCIDCHECYGRSTAGEGVECTVNYRAGHEGQLEVKPAEKQKRVVVVGGGPAGMEAALVAARRGHKVTVFERGKQLGGALLLQAMMPYKAQVESLTEYLAAQVRREGVQIRLGKAGIAGSNGEGKPDVVVIATGAVPVKLDIPGSTRENVISSGDIRKLACSGGNGAAIRSGWRGTLIRMGAILLRRPLPLSLRRRLARIGIPILAGKRVAVLGNDLTACQLADFLAEQGRSVTLVATEDRLANDLVSTLRLRLLKRLADRGVLLRTGVKSYEEVTEGGIVVVNETGSKETIPCDSIIPMLGFTAGDDLQVAFKAFAPEVYVAGDRAEPLKLLHAIHDGARVASEI